jgi:hypothetical protein
MKKVLEAYETALEAVQGMDFKDAMIYLRNNDLQTGICRYCRMNNIYFQETRTYIFQPPFRCKTTEEIIETLEFRINYLKQNHEKSTF